MNLFGENVRGFYQGLLSPLPPRQLGLQFNLVKPQKQKKDHSHDMGPGIIYRNYKGDPSRLLNEFSTLLARLNRHSHSTQGKKRKLDTIFRYAIPAINSIYFTYQGKERFPESRKRSESLKAAINVVQQLATGYKQVLQRYYDASDPIYRLFRQTAWHCGFRTMELIHIEQRLRVLRYQTLTMSTWADCHKLLFAAQECGEVGYLYQLSGCFDPPVDGKNPMLLGQFTHVSETNIRQLYINIQLFGLMDVTSWNEENIHIVESYISMVVPQISLASMVDFKKMDHAVYIKRDMLKPPVLFSESLEEESTLALDITSLVGSLMNDKSILKESDSRDIVVKPSALIGLIDKNKAIDILDAMLGKLQYHQQRDPRINVHQYSDMSVYHGFIQCFQSLNKSITQSSNEPGFAEIMAQKSQPFLKEHNAPQDGSWFIMNKSEGGMQLRIEEDHYSNHLSLGQLMAIKPNESEILCPQLFYIGRMNRTEDKGIDIALIKLADHTEGVVVQNQQQYKENTGLPAIIIQNREQQWQLLIEKKNIKYLDGRLVLRRGAKQFSLLLDDVVFKQEDYCIYGIVPEKEH